MPMAIVTPMLIGAAVGAVTAAVTGGNILKGALLGAVGGAIGGAFSMMAGATSSAASGVVGGATEGAAVGATTAAEAAAGSAALEAGIAPAAVERAAGAAVNNPSAFTAAPPAGMMGNNPSAYIAAGSEGGVAPPVNSTAIGGQSAAGSGLTPSGPVNTGMGPDVSSTGVYSNPLDGRLANGTATTPLAPTGSFLDNLLAKGSSMMNSRFGTDMAGKVISGFAQGQNQQAMLDWKQGQINDARANARFGNVGSRYATAGMMGPATYSTK